MAGRVTAETFSFSSRARQEQVGALESAAKQADAIRALVSVPCQHRLKNQKILLLIGEQTGEQWDAVQDRYEPIVGIVETRLRALGLRTYSP